MREYLNAVKVAALFIGTVIGAGFATGRELCLYFADSGAITLALSAALMGGFCFVFLFLGGKAIKSSPAIQRLINIITAVSGFFVYCAMLAATEELIASYFGIPLAGLFLGILSAMLSNSLEVLKKVNLILIPLLIAVVISIAAFSPSYPINSAFRPLNALGYCTMNMLFASALMREAGGGMRVRHMAVSGVLVASGMFALMYIMLKGIIPYKEFAMPFFLLATAAKRDYLGITVILIAILTTVIGCNKLLAEELTVLLKNRRLALLAILALGTAISLAGFMRIVNLTYPVISALGIAVCVYSLAELIIFRKSLRQNGMIVVING